MSVASRSARPSGAAEYAAGDLDLPALGAALWRKKRVILLATGVAALLTFAAVELITPKYNSESRVLIEGRDNIFMRPDVDKDLGDRNSNIDETVVTSQAQVIMSRDLAREVVAKLKLNELPEFDPTLNGISPVKAILGTLGFIKNPLTMTPEERVLDAYYDRLTVSPLEKSRVITIDFLSEDPELAAKVANAIADAYLERQQGVKQDQAKTAAQYLSGQIDSLRKKVVEAEGKVEAYRAKSNLLVGNNNTTLSAQQLGDMSSQLSTLRAQKTDAEAKARLIRDMLKSGQPVESSDILNSELIRRLSEQRVTLRAQLAEQSSTLLDNHPRIKELRAQIGDLDHQINNEAATIARSFENDAKLAGARVDSLTASLDQLKSQTALNNEDDVQLRELERDAKSQRDLLESYLAKYREANARDTLNSSPAEARVISRATVSNVPFSPKKLPTILIVTLTTLVLSAGFVVTQELLATPESMARVPAPPLAPAEEEHQEEVPPSRVAAVLGMFRKKSPRRSEPRPEPSRRETVYRERAYQEPAYQEPDYLDPAHQVPPHHIGAIDDVVADLSQNGSDGAPIAVFGAARGLDTSWTALKIARTLAETGSVILVGIGSADAAIRTASIDPGASGLAEYADGSASFGKIITKDRQSDVHLISSGHEPTDRREILVSETVPITFEALSRSYDYVVVAAGAAGGPQLEDVAAIAACAVLVAGTLTGAGTASARDRLLDAGFEDVTVVVGTTADLGAPAEAA
jgi:succinoglycan biosynthesis transport protein ExoP